VNKNQQQECITLTFLPKFAVLLEIIHRHLLFPETLRLWQLVLLSASVAYQSPVSVETDGLPAKGQALPKPI